MTTETMTNELLGESMRRSACYATARDFHIGAGNFDGLPHAGRQAAICELTCWQCGDAIKFDARTCGCCGALNPRYIAPRSADNPEESTESYDASAALFSAREGGRSVTLAELQMMCIDCGRHPRLPRRLQCAACATGHPCDRRCGREAAIGSDLCQDCMGATVHA